MNDTSTPATPSREGPSGPASEPATAPFAATPFAAPPAPSTPALPRVRWAGIVWGAVFAALGITVMSVLSSDASRYSFAVWAQSLGPWGAGLVAVVALGALLLVTGVLGAIARAQRAR
ncbi:hypothetical protein EDF46_2995 [Frondihabitans sp. PhB188]|uniref:hypothetical protein n=1 Tax=Frondihabitans sp. PhB188 TaxID=2485200 RepID=UPI000F4956AF|nr:hypothetical protein [Frondihabitans sp. PhB188]ROQ37536.1 hypothetical protein EDF46_2995 [Frondihabitans sp. PhB188]